MPIIIMRTTANTCIYFSEGKLQRPLESEVLDAEEQVVYGPPKEHALRVPPAHKRWKVYIPNDKNSTGAQARPSADVGNARLPFTSTTAFHVCLCRSVFSLLFKAEPPLSC